MDFGVRGGFKGLDFLLTFREDSEGWSLNSAGSSNIKAAMAGAEAGESAGLIKADEPVRLRSALRGIRKIRHFFALAEA